MCHGNGKRTVNLRIWLALGLVFFITCALSEERPYQEAALDAASWITASAVETEHGRAWPGVPGDEKSLNNTLYSGTPGVVLFFLETYYAIGDKALLEEARAGADLLLAALPQEKMPGLYTGISGIGFALLETYKATRDIAYKQGAEACLSFLRENVEQKGRGAQWGETTDIISGNAGTGLFLLYPGRELADPTWVELAASAGRDLTAVLPPVPDHRRQGVDGLGRSGRAGHS
jgi:hypothetical protein